MTRDEFIDTFNRMYRASGGWLGGFAIAIAGIRMPNEVTIGANLMMVLGLGAMRSFDKKTAAVAATEDKKIDAVTA